MVAEARMMAAEGGKTGEEVRTMAAKVRTTESSRAKTAAVWGRTAVNLERTAAKAGRTAAVWVWPAPEAMRIGPPHLASLYA